MQEVAVPSLLACYCRTEFFTDGTDVQCLYWWQKVLKPNLVKGVWTKSEDDCILELVTKHRASRSAGVLQYGQLNQESLAQHYEEESGPNHSHRSSIKSFGCIPSTSGFNEPHKFSGSIGILSEYGGEGWSVNK